MPVPNIAFVVDDHPLVARGISDFLRSLDLFEDVQAALNITELWQRIEQSSPKLVVIDFWLPDGATLPLIQQLRARCPLTAILVMSADDDEAVQQKVRNADAQGFIHKKESPELFAQAVRTLLSGKSWFVSQDGPVLHNPFPKEIQVTASELGLTTRQGEVLGMIMLGLPNKRIAKALGISEHTVKEHVSYILGKLEVHSPRRAQSDSAICWYSMRRNVRWLLRLTALIRLD